MSKIPVWFDTDIGVDDAVAFLVMNKLPQLEALKDQGVEILYFTEEVDEFVAQTLRSYKDKEFRSAMDGASDESAQEKAKEEADTHKDVFAFVKEALGDEVKAVRASSILKSAACCLSAEGPVSLEMEKYMSKLEGGEKMKADRVLELRDGAVVPRGEGAQ